MDPAIELLKDYGYIRQVENDIGYRGRKQTEYHMNPAGYRND
jgi:hypothetical protein